MVEKLSPLLKMFSRSLSSCSLLVHSAWQASCLWTTDPAKVQEGSVFRSPVYQLYYIVLHSGKISNLYVYAASKHVCSYEFRTRITMHASHLPFGIIKIYQYNFPTIQSMTNSLMLLLSLPTVPGAPRVRSEVSQSHFGSPDPSRCNTHTYIHTYIHVHAIAHESIVKS